ncbi:uncharacterized protein LOC116174518 [Photinus pyralis]|uniref:uncharacterized protein LOC116174518 n=1 Tax=Photinus pyralis TaxID=7054 RepID=UPI001267032E|nr:uncharacterized protein LOC116174518 [Photinus pyralis]
MRQLIDKISLNLKVLSNLGLPTDRWDVLIIHLVLGKLDYVTTRDWENECIDDIPVLDDLLDFLKHKCNLLESLQFDKGTKTTFNQFMPFKSKFTQPQRAVNNAALTVQPSTPIKCSFCSQSHHIFSCDKFNELTPENALQEARRLRLCTNCLREGHNTINCRSNGCKHCQRKHNTRFHVNKPISQPSTSAPTQELNQTSCNHVSRALKSHVYTFLSTATLEILDARGQIHVCRALLDAGSQSNFITIELANKLQLPSNYIDWTIIGINQNVSSANRIVNVTIKSKFNAFTTKIDCLSLAKITDRLPNIDIDRNIFQIPSGIKLADENFHKSLPVDILLGAEVFWTLLCVGQIKIKNQPILQKTHLGWIFGGNAILPNISNNDRSNRSVSQLNMDVINDNVKRFWEIEEIKDSQPCYSLSEIECENHFLQTYSRKSDGRFVVRLPFKKDPVMLGSSVFNAEKRFYSLEKRFSKHHDIEIRYVDFINEYCKLGHMSLVPSNVTDKNNAFYLPHHAVVNENKVTTKLRVVFDGSAKTNNGLSLNSILHVGPPLQQELLLILLRFRTYQFVISSDVEKMFRQIEVHKNDRKYQRIFWRSSRTQPLQTYELNTVTYGTGPAPYLAMRCIKQLGLEATSTPCARRAILEDFYVDDLLTGADDLDQAIKLRNEIDQILRGGCFKLTKWASNDPRLIPDTQANITNDIQLDKQSETKTLGLLWNCEADILKFSNNYHTSNNRVTKRVILSIISKIYDPLGLVGPVIVTVKILLQHLWQLQVGWDESVPAFIFTAWQQFCKDLPIIATYQIPRRVTESPITSKFELYGFCDASQKAYGACIYIKSISNNQLVTSHLMCSKSRIAPVKTITIPRLELCAALLLARLLNKVTQAINIVFSQISLYTDSTIVLAWLKTEPSKLKTFVANRVTKIQDSTSNAVWKHVPTKENPADIISRGALPSELAELHMWWHGPTFLLLPDSQGPSQPDVTPLKDIPDLKAIQITCLIANTIPKLDIFDNISSFKRLCNKYARQN